MICGFPLRILPNGILQWRLKATINSSRVQSRRGISCAKVRRIAQSFVRYGFARKGHLRSPLLREIFPPWILRFDQSNLFRSCPALQLLLSSNRLVDIVKALVINQSVATILACEPFDLPALMLQGAPVNAVGHADVKCSRAAADDVNKILVILHDNSHGPVILSAVNAPRSEAFTESKDPVALGHGTDAQGSSHHVDGVVGTPLHADLGAGRKGVLRLRDLVRLANQLTALRMTDLWSVSRLQAGPFSGHFPEWAMTAGIFHTKSIV